MSRKSGSFQQSFSSGSFFFADSRRKNGFQQVKSSFFCVGQQKKEPVKRTAISGHVNRLIMHHGRFVLNLIFRLLLLESNTVIKFFEIVGNTGPQLRDLSQIKPLKLSTFKILTRLIFQLCTYIIDYYKEKGRLTCTIES